MLVIAVENFEQYALLAKDYQGRQKTRETLRNRAREKAKGDTRGRKTIPRIHLQLLEIPDPEPEDIEVKFDGVPVVKRTREIYQRELEPET